jgi:proline iminopeptidase
VSDLFHVRHGRGRPVVVVHGGLGLDHTYMRELDRMGDVAELIYVDVRGNGRSPGPSATSIAAMADDIEALRAELGFERWTVVGHSYGSFIALTYAIRHPERVAGLVAIGTAFSFEHAPAVVEQVQKRDQPAAAAVLLSVLGQPVRDNAQLAELWPQILPLYYHRWQPRYLDALARMQFSAEGYNRGNELLATYNVRGELARIKAPTLVISGDDDFITPADVCGAAVAAGIENARHAVVPRSGHMPFQESPDAFDRELRAFLTA